MTLGYQRALQATDLWKMDSSRESALLSTRFDEAWARRCKAAADWNAQLESGEVNPPLRRKALWAIKALCGGPKVEQMEHDWKTKDGKKEASIAWALNDVLGHEYWGGGVFKIIGDISQLMGPLVVQVWFLPRLSLSRTEAL